MRTPQGRCYKDRKDWETTDRFMVLVYVEGEENENEEKERQDGVGRVVGSQKEGKRSVW